MTRTGEPSPARRGPVASSRRRGGARALRPRSRTSACSAGFVPRAVPVTVPAGSVSDGDAHAAEPWCWTPLPRCTARGRTRSGGRRLAAPAATAGGRSGPAGHHHLRDGSRRPRLGRDCPLHRHSTRDTAARRLRRDPGSAQAASQREAIVLTSCPDLSPDLAAAGMRVSLATLRGCLAEARSALRAVLPSNL